MKAIEVTGIVDDKGNLSLEQSIDISPHSRVRVIILYTEESTLEGQDPDDTPPEEVEASLRKALEEAKGGHRIPISQMWEERDNQIQ